MVSFTCGKCNTTLRKNQVEQHCQYTCRGAEFVSCVDCSTDFYGDDYMKHTSCITEAQKYGGKDYVDKGNKGQKKQELWVEKVQRLLDTTTSDDPRVKQMLEGLTAYPNIPHKKAKFFNFLKNSYPRYRHEQALLDEVWQILEEAKSDPAAQSDTPAASSDPAVVSIKGDNSTNDTGNADAVGQKKKKKKRNKSEGLSSNENVEPETAAAVTTKEKKKKKKKRRGDADDEDDEVLVEEEVAAMREKKWRKRDPEMDDFGSLNDTLQEVEKQPKDFNLSRLIVDILERKGSVSMKNLRKKALGEFWECGVSSMTEDKVLAKLDKKLRSMENVKVVNNKVYLAEDED